MQNYTYAAVVKELKRHANPANREGMARFGIDSTNALGTPGSTVRALAKSIGVDHKLAMRLYASRYHEAKNLAALIADPARLTERDVESWAADFYSWDVCDGACIHLLSRTPFAWEKAVQWSKRKEEFVKRAGYVLMAVLSVHDRKAANASFRKFFSLIERGSTDSRNFVMKAVNWALRQIGKRNLSLNREAIRVARRIQRKDVPSAKWIASNALRELESEQVRRHLTDQRRNPGRSKPLAGKKKKGR